MAGMCREVNLGVGSLPPLGVPGTAFRGHQVVSAASFVPRAIIWCKGMLLNRFLEKKIILYLSCKGKYSEFFNGNLVFIIKGKTPRIKLLILELQNEKHV